MDAAEAAYAPVHLTPMARARAILGGSAGNLIEWYDWFAYASFSLYFAKAFFPRGDQTAQLLQTAGVFAIGFFMRPIGAWITGVFADRAGRKNALTLSVAFMCLGSLILAVVPGYAVIGPAAPAILVLARVIQGLSLGGEYGASATYLSEMAGRRRRGLWSSFHFVTLIGGQLTALAVLIVLQNTLSVRDLEAWGWRVPFAIGALLALAVFWIQTHLQETASFHAVRAAGVARSVTATLVRGHWRASLLVFALTAGGSLGFYCFTTYMQKFLTNTAHFSKAVASDISAASLVVYLLAQPLGGALGDRIGRRALLTGAFLLGAATAWPLMSAIAGASSPWTALALASAALIILTGYSSVSAVVKSELFPAHVRGLGVALPYALANAVFGGTAEYVALAFKQAGHESAFYFYVSLVLALAGVAAVLMRETRGAIAED
jgi:MHS family alpha-ketoglutarate permease-like MFS transporter